MSDTKKDPPTLFTRIVVGVDAHGTCDHALRAGVELAQRCRAQLTLAHAVGSPNLDWEWIEDPRDAANNAGIVAQARKSVLRHVTALVGAKLPDGRATTDALCAQPGRPARVVLEEASRQDADLIVLGYDIHRPRFDFGSTARHVIAGAPKSVWIQKHAPAPIRRILVAVDLSPDSLLALRHACSLARLLGARVHALNVFSNPVFVTSGWPDYPDMSGLVAVEELRAAQAQDFERQMAAFDWQGVEHTSSFAEGDPAHSILDAQRDADLLMLATHGRTGLAAVFMGSVAARIVRAAHLPVLVVRHPDRVLKESRPARSKAQ